LTNQQAEEIYRELVLVLHDEGLTWIVDEVESAIRLGKTETSRIEAERPPTQQISRRRRRIDAFRHSQRDWTPEERLAILLDAVDAAVCKRIAMESNLVTVLPELGRREIVFAPGGFVGSFPQDLFRDGSLQFEAKEPVNPAPTLVEPYAVFLDQRRSERQVNADRLAELLQSVRLELNADLD